MKNNSIIGFRPVTGKDMALLAGWMEKPHWRLWWGEAQTELGYIVDMIEGRDTTRPFIFTVDGRDCGYIQYWTVKDQLFEPWLGIAPWMTDLPEDAIGVDLSIGDATDLGQGLGTLALAAFVETLRADGFEEIFIDPDTSNTRAIRAYEKAGFAVYERLEGKTGDTLIMRLEI